MKRQFLLGAALLGLTGAFAQAPVNQVRPDGFRNMKLEKQKYLKMTEAESAQTLKKQVVGPENNPAQNTSSAQKTSNTTATSINWSLLCGSMNCYGQLVSQTRPLQYNDNVNAVSLIHRKSTTYSATPISDSNAGTIVAEISSDWGTSWDSTCLYANVEAGRYPQGAIYAGPGNNNIANAYVVGSGPTVSNNAFTGNWYASKKLAAAGSTLYNTAGDATPGAQQFIAFGAPNIANHGWSRYGFTSTDDGIVRSLALMEDDPTTLGATRGLAVIKGTFNAGTFTWTSDTLIPNFVLDGAGGKQSFSAVQMAWNEAGTVGYAVMTGALNSATGSNRGFQPVIFKTTNSGASWALANGIDFNAPTMTVVLQHIATTASNPTLAIPAVFGDYDIVVDADDKLHIGTTLMSTFSPNDDSLGFVGQFTNGGESYNWGHTPGNRPYLYDFIGDGAASWNVVIVDSMSSEGPSSQPTGDGFNDNPWDPTGTGGAKIEIDSRIQLGRTPDGEYITFSWVESDTNFTSSAKKWNNLPDIKSRLMSIGSGTNMYQVANTEQNVTQYPASVGPANPEVITRATLHYMSPTTGTAAVVTCTNGAKNVTVKTPFTITNSNPYSQLTNNTTWYTTASLVYEFGDCAPTVTTSLAENTMNSLDRSVIFPNPAKNNAVLSVEVTDKGSVEVEIFNIVGQSVKTITAETTVGTNSIALDLNGMTSGVYLVKLTSGKLSSTKKLIIE
ncbi:MAG: T9SS type A sorting domain-containing protein [Bacteroidia bacterium]|nr:T9SS type A sorting domain-containing protein [Bacteroidia bacterium]